MSEAVTARIRAAIEERGPISFAEFMDHALYGPGGFYEQPSVGLEGHFVTSPHVHPVFAELLLRAIIDMGKALGQTEKLVVCEMGAGDGTLARNLLGLASNQDAPTLQYFAVERSPGARARLAELPIHVEERLANVGPLDPGLVFANELLDNLPFRRVRSSMDGTVEVRVGAGPTEFVEVEVPCDAELARWASELAPGEEANVPVEALRFVDDLARVLRRGYALLIDYGSTREPAGPAHAYRDQRVRGDVLHDPGSADITAGVDFRAIERRAQARGLALLGLVEQREALLALGFSDWADAQRERQGRMLAEGAGGQGTRVWAGRSRASLLVEPSGLGRLRWLLLSTRGLPAPAWAARTSRTSPTAD